MDTRPLVALLDRQDKYHAWVMAQMADIRPPMLTCEAVLAEATYLTSQIKGAREALIEMIGENFLTINLQVQDQHAALLAMVKRYVNVPMSLAGACIVRLAELHPRSPVFTLDSDFNVYRKNGRQVIEQICP